ncbi:hypothetical protein EPUS_08010 [Endocarpon pusillum Z07020]|uniref:Uncharacterized protein n=1 Tax=Endocarpon pusillum (strain Z07020 / HMAS-L-300199) TaxID=1263415 RepID=U1HLD6_ENDPU|nr:uncharacterized protein EPUS_08010 [Endocarpon pusillum Z07020]ERF69809.1 hypothetical protein EPUS_08010 [Endocarpon pusillum Z07020]
MAPVNDTGSGRSEGAQRSLNERNPECIDLRYRRGHLGETVTSPPPVVCTTDPPTPHVRGTIPVTNLGLKQKQGPSLAMRRAHGRRIGFSYEVPVLIAPKEDEDVRGTMTQFLEHVKNRHNRLLPSQHPRMTTTYIFRPWMPPIWLRDTSTWATEIDHDVPPMPGVPQLKRLAQAVIHFDQALEISMPYQRDVTNRRRMKGNWRDSPGLANKSRSEAIAAIEDAPNATQLGLMLHGTDSQFYQWCFSGIAGGIEVCNPREITVAEDAVQWVDFVLSFVQGSLACRSRDNLERFPPNHEGLAHFLSGKCPPAGATVLPASRRRYDSERR